MRPKHPCQVCQSIKRNPVNMVRNLDARSCLQCYRERIGISSVARPQSTCVCGKPKSHTAKVCMHCYKKRGTTPEMKEAIKKLVRQPLTSFEEAWALWQKTIGMCKNRYRGPAKSVPKKDRTRVLVIPDLHVPFEEPEMVAAMIAKEAEQTDVAIQIGDISDSYSLSRFAKYEPVSFAHEWAKVTLMMQTLSESFPIVKIIVGNHDARLRKALASQLTPDMLDAVTTMTGGTLCPVTALAKKFPNIEIASHEIPNSDHQVDWLMTYGDCLLAHPEKFSRVPGTAIRAFEEWVVDNANAMGIDGIRLFIMGHTHALSFFPFRAGSLLVECGCLCRIQGYMTSARIGGRPQRRGYVTFQQVKGVTDLNSVKIHWLDVEDGPWNS